MSEFGFSISVRVDVGERVYDPGVYVLIGETVVGGRTQRRGFWTVDARLETFVRGVLSDWDRRCAENKARKP